MIFPETIFKYIESEEVIYQTREITLGENWNWNMANHLSLSFHMKYGKYLKSSNDPQTKQPKNNIILPILEFRYAAEDRDVKDIIFETEDPEKQHLSFLIKKYWDDVFTIENNLDDFLDDAIEEKVDFGGCLVKKGVGAVPEVIPLQTIAFCDQTDIEGGPIGLKFNFSPEALKRNSKIGWGDEKKGADITIDDLIFLATKEKDPASTEVGNQNQVTGKNIEVYVVRGTLPSAYLKGHDMDNLTNQVQIVAFYWDEKNMKQGVTLYKAPEKESALKFHSPKKVFGRALGLGGVEILIDPQIWADFAEIHKNNFLKSSSKSVIYTDDPAYANRNKIKELENDEVTVIDRESKYGLRRIEPATANIAIFSNRVAELEAHAQKLAGVTDPLLGKQPPAGTPFRLQERVVFEGKKPHERTAGKFDKFVEEIIKDWVIPHMVREITEGTEFLSNLSSDQMEYVLRKVSRNRAVKRQWEDVFEGRIPGDLAFYEEEERNNLLQNGNQQILKILKDEVKNVKFTVKVRVSSKQKDMEGFVDKLSKVLQQYWALPPEIKSDPTTQHLMNQILEASGLPPATLGGLTTGMMTPTPEQATRPIRDLAKEGSLM
jgi:hypothetical protein